MNSDHHVRSLVGKLSRALGSDLADFVFEDNVLTLYMRFPVGASDRKLIKALALDSLSKCRVKFDSRNFLIKISLS